MKNPTEAMIESALAIDGPDGWFVQICEAAGKIVRAHGGTEEEIAAVRQLQAEMLDEAMPQLRALLAEHAAPGALSGGSFI
jgi:hypothetical protein